MCGGNTQTNQVSVTYALEKILKVGIISGSINSNIGQREGTEIETSLPIKLNAASRQKAKVEGSGFLDFEARALESPPRNFT